MSEVRVRFAPSPTGALHIGGVRTALYNYLFAKQHNGKLILRIEDTDSTRFVSSAEQYIIDSFHWLGIIFDEGVHIPNDKNIIYRQSDRKSIYKQYADYLLANKLAYAAFDTPEEIEEKRKTTTNFQYDASTRTSMKNALTLSEKEVQERIASGEKYVIRIRVNPDENIEINDLICGKVVINSSVLDDKVLWKSSDGLPTYHLANIVDDHLMGISHVIRGAEWLPSAPLHVLLYRYLGWAETMPYFAHLPLILKPEGNGKLSKRDGDRLGFPVFPLQWQDPKTGEIALGYKEKGFLPEAVVNFLALLGWNDGTEQEIYTMEELIQTFSLERVNKSGARFDFEKAKWFNHTYIQRKSNAELVLFFRPLLLSKGIYVDIEYVERVTELIKERISLIEDFWVQASFFFIRPSSYDENVIKKRWKEDTPKHLNKIKQMIETESPFDKQRVHDKVMAYITEQQLNMGQIMNCLRLSLVGEAKGPDIFEIIGLLGQEESMIRIQVAIETLKDRTA
ncbi:MAG: glutamate--tRNA ligase [Bacteroidales bacterium]|jgi:glutamyl-tRNA synthetase|nr:glutamate--tRNA ligase [Bacteroidales bacterium]